MADKELQFWTTPPNVFLVATNTADDNQVLGCISYQVKNSKTVEMNRLAVNSSMRRMRIGEKLVNALLDEARRTGYQTMYLETSTPASSAIRLYERMNFQFLQRCKFYIPYLDIVTGIHIVAYSRSLN